jgi:lipoprotein-anchoring transpeptidase ErfK/SrfK
MYRDSLATRIIVAITVLALGVFSVGFTAAVVNDYRVRDVVPQGVTIAGHDLSGMPEAQARKTIETAVSEPMLRPLTVAGDGKTWTLDPKGIVSIDVDSMLDDAYSTLRSATLLSRVDSALRGTPLTHDVKPAYSVDTSAIATWVAQSAAQVDRAPTDAKRTMVKYTFKIAPAVYGAQVDQTGSVQAIANALTADAALSDSSREVSIPVTPLTPRVLESGFKTAIIVSLSQCRIYLYNGAKLVKSYPCAPGRAGFPTPKGDFTIQSKQRYAPWINPGTPWAAGMPAMIPGGPGNPMGTTKIGITFPGVFMHGVPASEYGSIGHPASHGCMRMMPAAALDLYGRVRIGDPVYIRR